MYRTCHTGRLLNVLILTMTVTSVTKNKKARAAPESAARARVKNFLLPSSDYAPLRRLPPLLRPPALSQ